MRHTAVVAAMIAFAICIETQWSSPVVHSQVRSLTITAATGDDVSVWDRTVDLMLRSNQLRVRTRQEDTLIPGRSIERIDQYHLGVPIWNANITRQLDDQGRTVSLFGTIVSEISIGTAPAVSRDDAKKFIEKIGDSELGPERLPELYVMALDNGSYRLAWVGEIATLHSGGLRIAIDAMTGSILRRDQLFESQVANAFVGQGRGVLGDEKKLSIQLAPGGFVLFDTLRPPDVSTFDLRSNLSRALSFLNGIIPFGATDYGFSPTNDWNDPALVDAHVYSSETYDYYFKRFGRRGLDNADRRVWNIVHPVRRSDALTARSDDLFTFWVNAFYYGPANVMVYGEGLPAGTFIRSNGRYYDYFAGAIDIVAHELTHGVTRFSSNLEYRNESGALNESFSDIMGTSVEFFFQPIGSGPMRADYLLGEDIARAAVPGSISGDRSMENPQLYGQPDHYSKRAILRADDDNGGVHVNSGISNNAFYLAIEGGINRTSGIRVQGVGGGNREQIEKVFYRAFAQLMPSNANFSMARAITLRAAQDLYGLNSAPYNAVRDAWTAVGVN